MADRTSAEIFGRVFKHLAKNPTDENKAFAIELADWSNEYDFNAYQMDADEALRTLGVAHLTDLDDEE